MSRDFRPQFFSLIEPIWVPDKQAKMVFLKNLFSRRYSNLKFEKFDSAQANTARSRFFLKQALSKVNKKWGLWFVKHTYEFVFATASLHSRAFLSSWVGGPEFVTPCWRIQAQKPFVFRKSVENLRAWVFKGTVQRDFRPTVFFIIQTSLGYWPMG